MDEAFKKRKYRIKHDKLKLDIALDDFLKAYWYCDFSCKALMRPFVPFFISEIIAITLIYSMIDEGDEYEFVPYLSTYEVDVYY